MNNKVWVSLGKSREERQWKNQQMSWKSFVDRLREPKRTKETYEQYLKMSKDEQSKVKDVGGFVGGVVTGGRRVKNSVTSRSLITLDIDYCTGLFWDDFVTWYGNEAMLYSTHKHSSSSPRYRLIIPLSREVLPDEYEAIARRVADTLGINLFDPTTFQPERLMYWPSASIDGEYVLKQQEGEWLDSDAVLAEYSNWRDVSQWAYAEGVKRKLSEVVAKQEDPALKGGVVGVFCRLYGISEAIEKFITDKYEQTQQEDRWSYKEGSTSGGLIVYDNKWAFSHHSTDPVSGRLCNAFDLVRIHLFGDSDDRVEPGTPLNKKPSYDKMIELATSDEQVKKQVVTERRERKIGEQAGEEQDWASQLEVDKKGNILNTIQNCVIVLDNDPLLKGTLGYDDLRKQPIVKRHLPWRKIDQFSSLLIDSDDAEFRNYFEMLYGITSKDKLKDALEIVLKKNIFHPVRAYLKNVVWDGTKRLDTLLIRYLGAEDSPYVRAVTRKTLVAAVARVFQPGIKFDHVLTLVGPQGLGKSRLIARLAGEWYSDTFGSLQNKDAMEQIQGVWIMEIGELAGLKRQEVEAVKLFISKQEDRFRVAYARRVESFARQCIFIGTTNNDEFLQDATGNRRFWPVRVGVYRNELVGKDIEKSEIDQIWAEACTVYVEGEDLWLTGEIERMAKDVQEEHMEHSDILGKLLEYLNMKLPLNWYELDVYERRELINGTGIVAEDRGKIDREYVTIPEIWTELIGGTLKDMTKHSTKYLRDIMNNLPGWTSVFVNRKAQYGTQRGWAREGSVIAEKQKN